MRILPAACLMAVTLLVTLASGADEPRFDGVDEKFVSYARASLAANPRALFGAELTRAGDAPPGFRSVSRGLRCAAAASRLPDDTTASRPMGQTASSRRPAAGRERYASAG